MLIFKGVTLKALLESGHWKYGTLDPLPTLPPAPPAADSEKMDPPRIPRPSNWQIQKPRGGCNQIPCFEWRKPYVRGNSEGVSGRGWGRGKEGRKNTEETRKIWKLKLRCCNCLGDHFCLNESWECPSYPLRWMEVVGTQSIHVNSRVCCAWSVFFLEWLGLFRWSCHEW